MKHDSSEQADATAELLKMLAVADPFASGQQGQWYERLCAARADQQPLPVPQGAVVIWRCDLVRAVAELLQLRAYRDLVRAKAGRESVGEQAAVPVDVLAVPKAIMEINVDQIQSDEYKRGHRDARHAAADLVLELADKLAALAVPTTEQKGCAS